MGRQITVELVSLLKVGCTLRVQDYEDAQPWLKVVLPNGRWIGSDCIDLLERQYFPTEQRLPGQIEMFA